MSHTKMQSKTSTVLASGICAAGLVIFSLPLQADTDWHNAPDFSGLWRDSCSLDGVACAFGHSARSV
jgi:hypothetical protein